MSKVEDFRLKEIRQIHKDYTDFYKIGGGLTLIILGVWIGSLFFHDGYATNVYTELLSVGATVAVLDQINQWRAREALKKSLTRQAKGQSNETAKSAIDWMREEGWLTIADRVRLLEKIDLSHAQLEDANLINASLKNGQFEGTNLGGAYLQGADLSGSDMRRAIIDYAYLSATNLANSQLQNATFEEGELWSANLAGADLTSTILRGTILSNANLRNAKVSESLFDETTVLPDAIRVEKDPRGKDKYDKHWTRDTDMSRYTNPDHPNFWEPDYLKRNWDRRTFSPYAIPEWIKNIRRERFEEV